MAVSIVGEDGQPLFNKGDVFALGEKSAGALDRVFSVASRLSGIGEADIEDLGKPSESDQTDALRSA